MKTRRLLAYAAAGVIAGLLMENNVLNFRRKAGERSRKLKKNVTKKVEKLKGS